MIKRLFTGLLLAGLVFVGSTGTALALSPAQGTDLNSVEWRLTELRWNVGNLLATIESLPVRNASEIQVKIGLLQQALSLQTLIERLEGLSTPPVQPPFEPPLDLVQPILTLASVTNGHPVLNWTNQSNVLFTLYRRQGSTDFDFLAIPKPDAPDCDGNTTSLCRVLNGLSVTTATDSTVKPSGVYTYAVLARKNVESSGGASSWISNRVQATSGGNQAMVPVITSSQTTAQIGSDDEIVTTWSLPYSGTNWQWRLYNSTGTYLAPNGGISDGAAPTGSVAHSFTKIYYQNIDLVPGFYLMKLCSESVIDTQLCSNTVSFNLTAASASRTSISNVALSETNTTSTDSTSLANPTKLRPGTTQRVKWVDAHPVFTGRTYKIELLNNGSVYAPLAFAVSGVQYVANSPYHRYYDVSIPANLSGNGYYQLRVGITPSPTITPLESMTMNTSGQLTLASSPTTGSLRVTAPNGGEKWQIGSTHTILWTPYNPQNNVNTAFTQVEAYLDKVVNGQFLNVGRIVESGKASIHWVGDLNVNGNLAQPGDYYVRVVNKITGQTDRSDSPFKLVPQGTISVNLKLDGSENEIRNLPANGKQVLASWTSNAENGSCVIYVDVFGEQGEQYANLPATGSKSIFLGPHTGSVGINCTATTPIEGTANDKISVSQANASIRVSFPNQSGTSLRFDDQTNIILDTNKISRVSVALYKNDASYRWIARDFPVPETQRLQVISWRPSDVLTASEVVSGAVYKIYVIGFANDGTGGTVEDKSDAPFKFSELPPPPVVSNDIRKIITIDKGTYANGENITVSLKLKNLGTSRATISPNGCVVPNSRIYLGSTGADIEPLVYSQPNPVACTMALVELGPGEERTFTRTVPVGGNAYPVTNGAGYNLRLPYANSTYYLYFTVTNTTQTITPWIGQFSLGSNSNWSVGTSHTFTWTSRDLPATSKIHVTYFDANSQASASYPTEITQLDPSATSYTWTLPSTLIPGHSYAMRLSVIGTNGQTSGVLADTEGSGQMRADRTFTVSSVPSTVAITNVQLDVPLSGWMRYFHTVTGGTASSQWNTYVWFATQQSNKSQSCVVRPSLPDWQSGITSGQSQHDVLLQKASGSYDLCIELVDSNWQQFSPRIYSAGYPITVIPNTTATKTWQPSTAGWGTPYCNNNASDIKWSQHSDSTYTGPKIARCYTTASGGAVSASMSEMTEADRNLTGQDCSAYNTGIVVKTRVDSGYNYRCTESTISSSSSGQSQASMLASIASILEAMKSAF